GHGYVSDVAQACRWVVTQRCTVGGMVGLGPVLIVLQLAIAALTIFSAWRHRGRGIELAMAAGIFGSLLVTPYIGFQDFLMLVLASLMVLREGALPDQEAVMADGYLAFGFGLVFS